MKKSRNKQLILLLFLIGIIGVFSACGKTEKKEESKVEYYPFEPATEIKDGRKDIYVILKVLTSQYWQDIVKGITDAGIEKDCNIYVGADVGEGDWHAQKILLDQAVAEGADAIVLAPANSSTLSEYVAEVHAQGIPIILVDTILNDTESFDICYMTDNLQAGQLAAEEMIRLLKESGVSEDESISIAIQITSSSSQTVIDRLAGFNQYWSANAPENWKVLDEVKENGGDPAVAKQNSIDYLEEYPELRGVFGCNNSSTVGFVNGLTETGRNDVILVGFDYADETAALVASDDWTASVVVQNQYNMGYSGLEMADALINGNNSDYKFIDTETRVINHENYLEYEQSLAGE